jgi:hypothetical protein
MFSEDKGQQCAQEVADAGEPAQPLEGLERSGLGVQRRGQLRQDLSGPDILQQGQGLFVGDDGRMMGRNRHTTLLDDANHSTGDSLPVPASIVQVLTFAPMGRRPP